MDVDTVRTEPCPACGSEGALESLYAHDGAPVHDVVLLESSEAARAYPTGLIDLAFCNRCGYACNLAFDPARVQYDAQCEETQSSSPLFNDHHRRLAGYLVDRWALYGRHVVEIGCGKGEFLVLMREAGCGRCTGFDPAFVPGRIELPEQVTVDREMFDGSRSLRDTDCLVCKMTLEHIPAPRDFLSAVRRAVGRDGVSVFFQVPDAGRIFEQLAFWDIYYEHCSYFTRPALCRLFESTGFEIEEISGSYGGQYLTLFARTRRGDNSSHSGDLKAVRCAAEHFRKHVRNEVGRRCFEVSRIRDTGGVWRSGAAAPRRLRSSHKPVSRRKLSAWST